MSRPELLAILTVARIGSCAMYWILLKLSSTWIWPRAEATRHKSIPAQKLSFIGAEDNASGPAREDSRRNTWEGETLLSARRARSARLILALPGGALP